MTMGPAQAQSSATQPAISGDSLAALLKFGGLASLAVGGWIAADRLILSQRPDYRFSPKMTQSAQRADSNDLAPAQGNRSEAPPRSAIVIASEAEAPEVSEEPDFSAAVRNLRDRLSNPSPPPAQRLQPPPIAQRPAVPSFSVPGSRVPSGGGQNDSDSGRASTPSIPPQNNPSVANPGQSSPGQNGSSLSQDSTLAEAPRFDDGGSAVGLVPGRGAVARKKLPAPPDLSAFLAAPPVGGFPSATTASAFDVPSSPALPPGSIVAAIPEAGTPEGSTDYLTIAARPLGWVPPEPEIFPPADGFDNGTVALQPEETALPDLSTAAPESPDATEQNAAGPVLDIVPSTPELQAAANAQNVFVEQFTVEGSSIFSPEELAIAARNAVDPDAEDDSAIVGRELTPAELVRAGEAITQLYVDQGYLNSGAYVPADILQRQNEDGTPEIVVVEGSLEDITVEMEPPRETFGLLRGLQPGYVKHRLEQVASTPFNVNELLDAVRLLERDPLIEKISTELVPGTETGTSVLNVTAQPSQDLNISLSTDNHRSPSVGSVQQRLSLSQANIFGYGDLVTFAYGRSEGTRSIDLGFSAPLNSSNGTLTVNFNQSNSEVLEFPFSELDIESRSRTYEIGFRQPIKRTPEEEIALSLKASRRNSEGFFLDGATPFPSRGADLEGRTKISALRFGQDWIKRQPNQFFSVSSEFNLGLGLFGSTINPEPPDSRFLYWRGRGQWVRQLGTDSLFLLKGDVQLATNPLVPSEQFGLGGPATIRGYRQNSLLTDSGFLGSAEFQFPILQLPKLSTKLKLAPFFEFGRGWNVGEGSVNPEPNRLVSTGLGLLLEVTDDFNARVDWGFPLTDINNGGDSLHDSGVTFSVFWKAF